MALRADDVDLDRDRTLVQRFQAGDDRAFDELYRRYYRRLQRFCFRRIGDHDAAEEVTQEAFTRALVGLADLNGERRFYPWVSVIAARLCVDYFRRESRTEPYSDPNPGGSTGGEVEDIVDAVDSTLVVVALARLAPRHQDVLHLREIEGWSYQQIADHYGVTLGTVETLLFRARRALRRDFRLVDGAGLAAIPVLGHVLRAAGRLRHRIPNWLPSAPGPASLAAAATAAAAAVAIAVAPSRPPQHVAAAPRPHYRPAPAQARRVLAIAPPTTVIVIPRPGPASPIPVAAKPVTPSAVLTPAPTTTAASVETDAVTPTTSTVPPTSSPTPLLGSSLTVPSLPPISVPEVTLPALQLGEVTAPLPQILRSAVPQLLPQLLQHR